MSTPEERTARLAFRAAILGALIGGVGSLGGVYLSNSVQRQSADHAQLATAYVDVLSEAEIYRRRLLDLKEAAKAGDQALYTKRRENLLNESIKLYSSVVRATLISDEDDALNDITHEFFATDEPVDHRNYDTSRVDEAVAKGTAAMENLQTVAAKDLEQH
jgi:hypothetical protein